jgi:argininosuccinate lyase
MKQSVVNSYAYAIDVAEQLVIKKNLPFRTAHRLSGSLVKLAVKKDMISLSDLDKHQIEPIIDEIASDIRVEDVIKILTEITPEKSILLRSTQGSPNPVMQKLAIRSLKARARKYSEKLDARRKHLTDALDVLEKITSSYIKM